MTTETERLDPAADKGDAARVMDSYEPAPSMRSRIGLTLETYIFEGMLGVPHARGHFTALLNQIALAAKLVTSRVRRAGLADVLGYTGNTNVQGEKVQKLDVETNETLMRVLSRRQQCQLRKSIQQRNKIV